MPLQTVKKLPASSRQESRELICETSEDPNLQIVSTPDNDLLLLEGCRHLYHQTTDSLCASINCCEDEIEDEDELLLDAEEWNERRLILEDAANLSRLADYYLNPHKPLVPTDPYIYGRNYFSRPSAFKVWTMEGDEDDDMEYLPLSNQTDRMWVADMRLPALDHEDAISDQNLLKDDTIGPPDPSCVLRFGLNYDSHGISS